MNPIRNCHRLLNKLCWTVEQRDIFASGITQRRPHTSICAKPGFVIVFHSEHFSCYFPPQRVSITQPNFHQNAVLAKTMHKGNLTILFPAKDGYRKPSFVGEIVAFVLTDFVFHKMHLRLLCGPEAECYNRAHIHPINLS